PPTISHYPSLILLTSQPPNSTLFPYTTLFRSHPEPRRVARDRDLRQGPADGQDRPQAEGARDRPAQGPGAAAAQGHRERPRGPEARAHGDVRRRRQQP